MHLKHNLTQPRPILGIQLHSSLYQFATIIFLNKKEVHQEVWREEVHKEVGKEVGKEVCKEVLDELHREVCKRRHRCSDHC